MSKAFVIKNKEGKYYDCWSLDFTDIINECTIYQDRQTAENDIKNCIKDDEYLGYKDDCEVVEITIAEENLEYKTAVLERALKNTCWLLYGTYDEHYPNCFMKQAEKELKGEQQ